MTNRASHDNTIIRGLNEVDAENEVAKAKREWLAKRNAIRHEIYTEPSILEDQVRFSTDRLCRSLDSLKATLELFSDKHESEYQKLNLLAYIIWTELKRRDPELVDFKVYKFDYSKK
jgi:hypothetical protein